MSKVLKAEYDAATNTLRLAERVDGLRDHDEVDVTIFKTSTGDPEWMKFRGILSKEEGEDFARALNELFPPWDADE
jgi:hypothetical protein